MEEVLVAVVGIVRTVLLQQMEWHGRCHERPLLLLEATALTIAVPQLRLVAWHASLV